ncbi:hypothetical protein Clacol_002098 [Clathrus columnatus]|uniref:Uncharacterized protein n=1 Tax=Clathrus columnatus TaxID=1419009 RepID=A0AAV4ZZS6_9AGAM|nr:hypothetical protein Clacol_002098 [Clathrus columnatus]
MPPQITDATVARGIPLLGYNATTALSLTLTLNQVEAMCARLVPTKKLIPQSASTQFPSEIDFKSEKMYIGNNTVTSFDSGEETGVCKMSSETQPTSVEPPAGSFLSAPIIGKLTIRRGLDDVASDLRNAPESEKTKNILIATGPNGRKPRVSGIVSLTKQAITSSVVSSQINSTTPHPTTSSVSNKPSKPSEPSHPTPSSSTTIISNSTIKDPDFNSLRSRILHFIATVARPREVAISDFMNAGGITDSEADVRKIFDQIAQEIPGPKKSNPAYWKWDLKSDSWLEVRPFGFPDYTADQRTQASRRARIYSRISPRNPVWEHFTIKVDSTALASAKAIAAAGVRDGSSVKSKKAMARPSMPKIKSASKIRLEDKKEPSQRPSLPADDSTRKRKLADRELEPTSDIAGELPSKKPKRRKIIGLSEASKHDTTKITKKAPATEKDVVGLSTSKHNPEFQGTKVMTTASHRTNSKVRERGKESDHRDREKEKERVMDKESASFRTEIDGTKESVDRIKDNKGPARVKRKRRVIPSFSSDDEKDETQPPGPKRAATPTFQSTFMNTTTPKEERKSMPSPVALPNNKEGLQYQYGMYYAKYLHITSKFYAQKAKVEAAFALEKDENTVREGSNPIDLKKLSDLCEELHQTRNELERIQKAHGDLEAEKR